MNSNSSVSAIRKWPYNELLQYGEHNYNNSGIINIR